MAADQTLKTGLGAHGLCWWCLLCRQGANQTGARTGTLASARAQQRVWQAGGPTAGSWGAAVRRPGSADGLRTRGPPPGGRGPYLGPGPATPGGVRVSAHVVPARRLSADLRISPPASGRSRGTAGGGRGGVGGPRAGAEGLEEGFEGRGSPAPLPCLRLGTEEPGSLDQSPPFWHHDAWSPCGGSGLRGAPRSGQL